MSRDLRAGIEISDGTVKAVALEFDPDGVQIRYLNVFESSESMDSWITNAVSDMRKGVSAKIPTISVVLDNSNVFLHGFPLDTSLSKSEQNEYVQWELSNYLEDFRPQAYISDVHILRSRSRDQVSEAFTVNVKRDLLFGIQETLAGMKINLRLTEIQHFGAQYSLLAMYPELRLKNVLLVGFSRNRIDAGLIAHGRLTGYRYALVSTYEQCRSFLQELIVLFAPSDIVAYGASVSPETVEELHSVLEKEIIILNPFRKLSVAPSFRGFSNFAGREHHFASCTGCVLKKE